MPIHRTTKNGKPAMQYGTRGAKYTYTAGNKASREAAKKKCVKQRSPFSGAAASLLICEEENPVAKRKTTSRPARTPIGPVAPPPMIGRMQQSGMMRFGDGQVPPAVNIAARVRKPTGRKAASSAPDPRRCRRKPAG